LRWEGHLAEADPCSVATLADSTLNAVWEELEEEGFLTLTADEQGDLTRFIRLQANGRSHRVAWIPGRSADGADGQAQSLATLYRRLSDMAAAQAPVPATPGESGP